MGSLVLARHADTAWTESGQHTGRTDLPLNDAGREAARRLGERLAGREFELVLSSPLSRALETARLAGRDPQLDDDLVEWDYGAYEGITTPQIREQQPGWDLWRDGCPAGENTNAVGARADRVLAMLPQGDTLLFAHGHFLRVLTARWLGLEPAAGALWVLDPGALATLGYERERRVLRAWNW